MKRANITEHEIQLRGLDLRSESLNEESRTVEVVVTTESPVVRWAPDYSGRVDEILLCGAGNVRMDRANAGLSVLDSHDNRNGIKGVLGVATNFRFEAGQMIADVRFAMSEEGTRAMELVKDGMIRQVSVGYKVHRYEVTKKNGEGRDEYRATDWEPLEVSLVAIPADYKAAIRAEVVQAIEIETRAEGPQNEDMSNNNPPSTPQEGNNNNTPPAVDEQTLLRAERQRVGELTEIATRSGMSAEQLTQAINDGTNVDQFRAAAFNHLVANQPQVNGSHQGGASANGDEAETRREAMQASLILRTMGSALTSEERARYRNQGADYAGFSLLEMCRRTLEAQGVNTKGMSRMDIAGRALNTTGDFPVVLENVMNKTLLAAYVAQPDTWRSFCATGTVTDFRQAKRYRMGSLGNLPLVQEGAEYTVVSPADAQAEAIGVRTRGYIIQVSREMLVNDDLGAFNQLPSFAGRAAARTIEQFVYDTLFASNGPTMSDGNPLFHATHGNIGTGAAIGVNALDADRVLMASQKEKDGNDFLDLRPSILLVPLGLEGEARVINDAQYDPDTANKLQRPNKVRGLFSTIIGTPRLTGTVRYLISSPGDYPFAEVAFLDGQQEPYMEMDELFTRDGAQWKVRLDFGVAAMDWRAIVRNAGQ